MGVLMVASVPVIGGVYEVGRVYVEEMGCNSGQC